MKKPQLKLTKEESEFYVRTVKEGAMDDMFDFGYAVGRRSFAIEQLDKIKNKQNETNIQFVKGEVLPIIKGSKISKGFELCDGKNGNPNLKGAPGLDYIIKN